MTGSSLRNATSSSVAPLFNFGLLLAGFLAAIYSVTVLTVQARFTGCILLVSALLLQLVAVFDEVYGFLHFLVSVLLFVSFGLASLAFAVEKRSALGLAAFVTGLGAWAFYYVGLYGGGIAIPELISSAASVSWVISSSLNTLRPKK